MNFMNFKKNNQSLQLYTRVRLLVLDEVDSDSRPFGF